MELLIIKNARYIKEYKIELAFNTGEIKKVNLANQLDKPIFKPLKQVNVFKKFKMNPFTIEWENGVDFSPEYLYRLVQSQENSMTKNRKVQKAS